MEIEEGARETEGGEHIRQPCAKSFCPLPDFVFEIENKRNAASHLNYYELSPLKRPV